MLASPPTLELPPDLVRLRALCASEEIAATFRHRALNDLSGIGAMLFTLKRRLNERYPAADDDREIKQLLSALDQRILDAGKHLPERFLAPPNRRSQTIELGPALSSVLEAAARYNIAVRVEGGGKRAAIDAQELQVAASCLVENAVEALIPAGGSALTVRLKDADHGETAFELDDDGEGIAEVARDKMFDPFFTTRAGHIGLGLKIARRIARRWGGEILVEARELRGVRARLTLPSTAPGQETA